MKNCKLQDCENKHYGKGYCSKHYKSFARHGDPYFVKTWPRDNGCSIDGCHKKYFGRGFCQSHHTKWRKYGDPLISKRVEHGLSNLPEYNTWIDIKKRCTSTTRKDYKHYGGRGIKICKEWEHDFVAFYEYIGKKPTPKHSIDRINVDGDYEPGNVRWVTQQIQVINRRLNHTNKSGVAGVTPLRGHWQAQIRIDGKSKYLGFFKNVGDAILARKKAESLYWSMDDGTRE